MTCPQSLIEFEQHIAATNKPFEVLESLGGPSARVRFTGQFCNRQVLWDARVMTLEAVLQQALESGEPPPTAPRQFIDIGADQANGRLIHIGLHVPAIDEPTIWKTITMIRNYKRLGLGRREWGQAPLFPA
jgi:hypothetical protein